MNYDQYIVDAEDTLIFYRRGLREGVLFGVADVRALVEVLDTVLEKHAELLTVFEPPSFEPEYYGDDDAGEEPLLEPDIGFGDDPGFPFNGDGDHSDSRGNG